MHDSNPVMSSLRWASVVAIAAVAAVVGCSGVTSLFERKVPLVAFDVAFSQTTSDGPGPIGGCYNCVAYADSASFTGTISLGAETTAVINLPPILSSERGPASLAMSGSSGFSIGGSDCGTSYPSGCVTFSFTAESGSFADTMVSGKYSESVAPHAIGANGTFVAHRR